MLQYRHYYAIGVLSVKIVVFLISMHCRVADIAGQKQLFMYENIKYRKDMKSTAQANMLCESPWKV